MREGRELDLGRFVLDVRAGFRALLQAAVYLQPGVSVVSVKRRLMYVGFGEDCRSAPVLVILDVGAGIPCSPSGVLR